MVFPTVSSPTLHALKPTATTASFTVTTRASTATLPARLKVYTLVLVRIIVGLAILFLLWTKYFLGSPWFEPSPLEVQIADSFVGQAAARFVEEIPWRFMVPAGIAGLWLVVKRTYTEESLLVLRGLGVQTSTSSATYLTTAKTRFIPTTMIQDIFIHEAFKGFEVRFYLAIVVEGEEDAVVVFPNLLPKRQQLEEVWRGARACLHEPTPKP